MPRPSPASRRDAGMSLIGLLALVVILAALAGGAFLALRGTSTPAAPTPTPTATGTPSAAQSTTTAIDAARVAACQALVVEVQTALTLYQAQHGTYPESLAALSPGLLKTDPTKSLAVGQSFGYSAATGSLTPRCSG